MESKLSFQIELVEKCKANDRKAQMKLYRQYCEGMYCVAMRFLKNEDDAEDVLQEAFIKAFQKLDQFRGDVTFGAWLKRIVVNKCLDFIKAKKVAFTEIQEQTLRIVEDEDWTVKTEITMEQVKEAMQQLPEKYRFVVQLFLVEGYDHQEISQILDLREPTCRTRLLRGKGYLKELLKEKRYVTGS
ncbi:MAG: RNA polymerase sigma factor [Flavobacteriaceae bacterium]